MHYLKAQTAISNATTSATKATMTTTKTVITVNADTAATAIAAATHDTAINVATNNTEIATIRTIQKLTISASAATADNCKVVKHGTNVATRTIEIQKY